MLRRVADAHGLAQTDATTREELIERLLDRLTEPMYARQMVSALTPGERALLAGAHATDGELRGLLLDSEQPGIAEELSARGVLFRIFAAAGPLRGEVFVVPEEFLRLIPAAAPAVAAPKAVEPPAAARWTDPAFSLFALASAVARGSGSERHLEEDVRAWSEQPGDLPWDARWTFLKHLALSGGLLTHRADGVLSAGSSLSRLLDDPPSLADRLWRIYLNDKAWSELERGGLAEHAADLADGPALRRAVLDVLDGLPVGVWFGLDQVSAWVHALRPNLVREQLTPRGVVRYQSLDWQKLEQPLLRYVLLGPLYWLGAFACSPEGGFFARRDRSRHPPAEACQWEGKMELVAPARTQLGVLLRAERYLVLHERGRVSRYHLVQSHVAAALSAGGSMAECRELLRSLTRAALPSEVEERFESWQRRFGALRIRPAVVLEADTADELQTAIEDEQVRPFVRGSLGPTAAEVAASDALELAAALRTGGHLPRVDAALRLAAQPRAAFAGLVDEQVLEFLLVSLLAFQLAYPERLAELEGSSALLERLEHQFAPERLAALRSGARRLAGQLLNTPSVPRSRRTSRHRRPRKRD